MKIGEVEGEEEEEEDRDQGNARILSKK